MMLYTALESHSPFRKLRVMELKQYQHLHKSTREQKIKHFVGEPRLQLRAFSCWGAQYCETLIFYNYRGASYHKFRSLVI